MIRRPPRSTRTDTLLPYTTLVRSARRGMGREFLDQIGEFPFGAATDQRAVLDRADPGRIIAAIFHAAQPVDEAIRHLILADDSDDSAHGWPAFLTMYRGCGCPAWRPENPS